MSFGSSLLRISLRTMTNCSRMLETVFLNPKRFACLQSSKETHWLHSCKRLFEELSLALLKSIAIQYSTEHVVTGQSDILQTHAHKYIRTNTLNNQPSEKESLQLCRRGG